MVARYAEVSAGGHCFAVCLLLIPECAGCGTDVQYAVLCDRPSPLFPGPQTIEWLVDQPFQYFVMSKGGSEETAHTIPQNRGDEIVLYAKFIVDNYDALPRRIIFAHAHERSWHQRVRCSVTPL